MVQWLGKEKNSDERSELVDGKNVAHHYDLARSKYF